MANSLPSFSGFTLKGYQLDFVKKQNQRKLLMEHMKRYGIEPDKATFDSFYSLPSAEDINLYRRVFFNMEIMNEGRIVVPEINNNVPSGQTSNNEGNNEEQSSGSTAETSNTGETPVYNTGETPDTGATPEITTGNTEAVENETNESNVNLVYMISNTTSPTQLFSSSQSLSAIKEMEIDGILLDYPVHEFLFDTSGAHKVSIELFDNSKLSPICFAKITTLREVALPDTIEDIKTPGGIIGTFNDCSGLRKITCLAPLAPKYDPLGYTVSHGSASDFYGVGMYGTLYVPAGSIASYTATTELNNGFVGQCGWIGNFSRGELLQTTAYNLKTYNWTIKEIGEE